MCGIAGFVDERPRPRAAVEALAEAMAEALRHRGPDDDGIWVDEQAGIGLGHRRLSIIDLGPSGHQPMTSADGRLVIVYNGEIYNHAEVGNRLREEGVRLRGRSDTEVLVEGFARWGIAATLARCEGMFALAVWDRQQRVLTLARDRLGIKPLYWSGRGGLFLFASELKAMRRHPDWRPSIDPGAMAAFLRVGYVPAPGSIFRDTYKLAPGELLTVQSGGGVKRAFYWRLREIAAAGIAAPMPGGDGERIHALEQVLRRAVRNEMVADVPIGAFLSGGVDSSLVVSLMQAESPRKVRTFTIGFAERDYDEARHARRVAEHLGTEHTEFHVEERAARDVIPRLPEWYDEPFADSSQIPTQLVSALARQHVSVALSGDGGDELFAGYDRHRWALRLASLRKAVPTRFRHAAGDLLRARPDLLARLGLALTPERLRPSMPEQKLLKLGALLREDDDDACYRASVSLWPEPARLVAGAVEPPHFAWSMSLARDFANPAEHMMLADALTYLPDDLLTKVDRASMSVSLEVRVPLLNHRVVEAAWHLPLDLKLRHGTTKWALRQILYRHVPRALIERPKQGFAVPLAAWLRGPLRGWADDLLSATSLRHSGWLEPDAIVARWQEHRTGRKDWSQSLWAVLMLRGWLDRYSSAADQLQRESVGAG